MSCDVGKPTEGSSFSNLSVTSPTSQLILQPFRRLTSSQLIVQPFRCFTYVTAHSPTLLSHLLRHRLYTYVTWRAAHGIRTWGSRARQHQRSLAPVMIVFLMIMMANDVREWMVRKFSWHLCYSWGLSVLMPTHCTITRFGFRARRIDGVKCGPFSNHAPLGQTTLRVGRVSVQCCRNLRLGWLYV